MYHIFVYEECSERFDVFYVDFWHVKKFTHGIRLGDVFLHTREVFRQETVKKKNERSMFDRSFKHPIKKGRKKLNEEGYESSSESEEDDVKVKQEDDVEPVSNIKFYIMHQHAAKR
ncbi:hypothetical protein BDF21DRAFT_405115 [Thamnidium elegans]|nr:hypothetical protein BDF21DRAFT_405115 [Thamnidium elegans]